MTYYDLYVIKSVCVSVCVYDITYYTIYNFYQIYDQSTGHNDAFQVLRLYRN
jgi:hypothetical protein